MRWVGVLAVCVVLEGKSEFGWDNSVRGEERGGQRIFPVGGREYQEYSVIFAK